MITSHTIASTTAADLEFIYTLYDEAISYQRERGFPFWNAFDMNVLLEDVKSKNHYKVMVGPAIAIVFSVCYSEKLIWRHWEKGDAMYLHRIVVNPKFKGHRLFSAIVEWAFTHAQWQGLSCIRMDTWANNTSLIEYYKSFGFRFVENFTTPDNPALPSHNRNLTIALLEITL